MPRAARVLLGREFGSAQIVTVPASLDVARKLHPALRRRLGEATIRRVEEVIAIVRSMLDPELTPPPADVRATLRALAGGASGVEGIHEAIEARLDLARYRARRALSDAQAARLALRAFGKARRGRKRSTELYRCLVGGVRAALKDAPLSGHERRALLAIAALAAGFGASDARITSGVYRRK